MESGCILLPIGAACIILRLPDLDHSKLAVLNSLTSPNSRRVYKHSIEKEGEDFDCATWLHKARGLPKEEFRREVEKELTGKGSEPWEIIYFKLYKSQVPLVEQAMETAGLMLKTTSLLCVQTAIHPPTNDEYDPAAKPALKHS